MHAVIKPACKHRLKSWANMALLWRQTKPLKQCLISVWNSSANAHSPQPLSWRLFINQILCATELSSVFKVTSGPTKWLADNRMHPSSLLRPLCLGLLLQQCSVSVGSKELKTFHCTRILNFLPPWILVTRTKLADCSFEFF